MPYSDCPTTYVEGAADFATYLIDQEAPNPLMISLTLRAFYAHLRKQQPCPQSTPTPTTSPTSPTPSPASASPDDSPAKTAP